MNKKKLPLHIKVSSLSCFFLFLFSGLILIITDNILHDKLTDELQQDTLQLIKAINEKAEFIILFESEVHIDELHGIFESFSYVKSSVIRTTDGQIISSFLNQDMKKSAEDIIVSSQIYPTEELQVFEEDQTQNTNSAIGEIEILVSTYRLQKIQKSILSSIAFIGILFSILSTFAYFMLTKQILRPMHNLIRIMQRFVSNSQFTSKAPIGSTKEMAEIADAYNKMMDHVESSAKSLDQSNQQLKLEIQEKEASFIKQQKLEEQLSQAQKLEAIGRMTAAIAHDFNNILGGILGFSRLAMEELTELETHNQPNVEQHIIELKDSLSEIHLGGERAQDIIKQLLTSSRKAEARPTPLHVHEAINRLYPLLNTSVSVNINIGISTTPDQYILIDATHFEQIVLNLVINAKDAMDSEGSLKIESSIAQSSTIRCSSCREEIFSKNTSMLKISIADTGSGIAEQDLAQIFDPFFSTKAKDKGTGMGLSIIHGLVHENNGHIYVDSKLGSGTSFNLFFPLTQEQEDTTLLKSDQQKARVTKKSPNEVDQRPIMVVDDDVQLLKFMRLFLTSHGYQVESFEFPTEALTTFIQNKGDYSLVISDYVMPKLSGDMLCKAILKFKPATQVIICSGYNDDLHNQSNAIDGVIYMAKPVDHDLLLEHIGQYSQTQSKI